MLGIRLKADRPHHAFHTAAATRSTGQLPALLPVLADRKACRSRFRCVVTWIMPVLLVATALVPGSVHGNESGGVAWHRSIEQATAAAAGQNRQVLVLFTAAWSPASTQLKKHVLNDPDAVSLLNACFETVLIDVDDDPETTNSLGMRHVPGGCILAADGSVVSRFECPSSTGLFIATVARQLQQVPPGDLESAQPAVVAGTVTVVAEQPELRLPGRCWPMRPQPAPSLNRGRSGRSPPRFADCHTLRIPSCQLRSSWQTMPLLPRTLSVRQQLLQQYLRQR